MTGQTAGPAAERIDGWVLWPRAVVVGSLALGLGVVGHVSADGLLPGPVALGVMLVMAIALSAPMLARPASALRLVAMLVGGQTVVHLALTVTAGHAGDRATAPSPVASGGAALPTVDGHRVGSLLDAYAGTAAGGHGSGPALPVGHLLSDLSAHAPMMGVHLAAAALVGLWLAVGEHALWTLLALAGRRLVVVVRLVPVTQLPLRLRATADRSPSLPRSRWHVRAHPRRGPPALAR